MNVHIETAVLENGPMLIDPYGWSGGVKGFGLLMAPLKRLALEKGGKINGHPSGNRFRWVYHFAACAAEWLSHSIRRFNYINNLIGSVNLINAFVLHRSAVPAIQESGQRLEKHARIG